jgi:hypothetical protein
MAQRAKYWRTVLSECERSGLTQAAFCRQRGIKPVTFYWWKRRLMGAGENGRSTRGHRTAGGKGNRFVEVVMGESLPGQVYEVLVSGGRVIRLPGDFDPDCVARLVAAVESAC